MTCNVCCTLVFCLCHWNTNVSECEEPYLFPVRLGFDPAILNYLTGNSSRRYSSAPRQTWLPPVKTNRATTSFNQGSTCHPRTRPSCRGEQPGLSDKGPGRILETGEIVQFMLAFAYIAGRLCANTTFIRRICSRSPRTL